MMCDETKEVCKCGLAYRFHVGGLAVMTEFEKGCKSYLKRGVREVEELDIPNGELMNFVKKLELKLNDHVWTSTHGVEFGERDYDRNAINALAEELYGKEGIL